MKTRHLVMLAVVGLAAMVTLAGCKKKEEPKPPPVRMRAVKETPKPAEEMKQPTVMSAEEVNKTVAEAAAQIEQTTCPVMDGNKIDKNVFVEYKGKKVYFCCPDCKAKFEANPEKYVDKLPQFKQ
jgi:YHS domain-containing protein